MEIQQTDDHEKGTFFVKVDDKVAAEMGYSWRGADRIIIEHTMVSEILKGKGVGKQLVAKAVDFARSQGIKIVPLCPFAKSILNKVKEYNDVL